MNSRQRLLMVLLAVVLLLTVIGAYSRLSRLHRSAEASREDLETCRELATAMAGLKDQPAMASEQEKQAAETSARIERAAKASGIGKVHSIDYQSKQRIEKTSYKKKPIRVALQRVTTAQLITMLHALGSGEHPLRAETISLTAPNAKDMADIWNVDMVLTYWIYEPQENPKL